MSEEYDSDISEEPSAVLLALPDGPAEAAEIKNHTISFIGGYPTFPAVPGKVPESVACGVCQKPIPLLAQVYCPLVDGENDRTLYVWACPRPGCARREGSVRAYRASVRNEEYAADAAAKRAEAERIAAEERARARVNPFAAKNAESSGGLFGSSNPFGGAASNPFAAPAPAPAAATSPPTSAVANLSLSSSTTLAAPLPAFQPPQYLSTIDEYLPLPESDDEDVDSDDEESAEQKAEWREDGWDKILPKHVDNVFERFVRRLHSAEDGSHQVLRYEFGGMPLPYISQSDLFKKLFPNVPAHSSSSEEDEPDLWQYFTTKAVPPCPKCGAKRVFELQLVPHLINELRPANLTDTGAPAAAAPTAAKSEQERKEEIQRILAGKHDGEFADMEWGSILVFACEGDCVGVAEEWVGVEWEAAVDQV